MGKAILGFPCRFDDNEGRKTIRWVLKRIRERSPRDLQRLRRQVLGFRWLSRENIDNGYGGCFESEEAMRLSPGVKVGAQTLYPPGWVQIPRGLKGEYLSAVIAHEIGHAATTIRDFDKCTPKSDNNF